MRTVSIRFALLAVAVASIVLPIAPALAHPPAILSEKAQKLVAEPTTITGSIGVIGMMPNFRLFEEKYGVSFHVVTQSDRKELLNLGGAATPGPCRTRPRRSARWPR